MKIPKSCSECEYRIIDKLEGDSCRLLGFSIMDNRFTYEAEMHKINSFRNSCCPLPKEEHKEI